MKLSDPFGRMELRHKKGYESMRDSLRQGGVDTPEMAFEVIRQSKQRAQKFLGISLVLLLILIVLLPKALPIAFGLALFMVVFVVNSAINGRRYIERYIDEELNQGENGKA